MDLDSEFFAKAGRLSWIAWLRFSARLVFLKDPHFLNRSLACLENSVVALCFVIFTHNPVVFAVILSLLDLIVFPLGPS